MTQTITRPTPTSKPPAVHHTHPPIRAAFRQPRAVWAIAFATTISFMGIGLVDPILPAISHDLGASPTQAMLLFTSYLVITALAMFFTSWVSSRLGVWRTLLIGLALVVTFALLCALSNTVNQIIGWRGGWGLGNALFISTALSAIVASASGGSAGAIILYEAAIGIGMAVGPLAGGVLGDISWRGPFFGTAALMAIGALGIALLYPRGARRTRTEKRAARKAEPPVKLFAAFAALKHPALRTLAMTALLYNMAFFVLLAYSPFPLEAAALSAHAHFGEMQLGLIFFAWGIGLAITSVGLAPIATRHIGLLPTIGISLAVIAALMAVMAVGINSLPILVGTIAASGLIFGLMNTALTEAVMDATDMPRHIASSAYSGVRFFGGAISSASAGPLALATSAAMPYFAGIICALAALVVLVAGRKHLAVLRKRIHLSAEKEAAAIALGSE